MMAPQLPTGWTTSLGAAGRPNYTSPDESVRIQDSGRGPERFQVIRIKGGQFLEDLGWPSLKGALEYVAGTRKVNQHPVHRMTDEKRNWNQQMKDQNRTAGQLTLSHGVVDTKATASLAKLKLSASNRGDIQSAVVSAGFYAQKLQRTMFVYSGNSYGSAVWRVSAKPSEYLNFINNTGTVVLSVSPELVVTRHEINRGKAAMKTAASYVQISRDDIEEWLDHLPSHGAKKWHLKPGKAGIYLIPLSDVVAVKLSSTIGTSDDAMGRGQASMQLALVSLVTGQTLNKKAQGQGHFKRTTNWKTTWAKGFDLMRDAYVKAQGFYDSLAAIEDRDKYKADILKKIESVPGWTNDNLLADFHSRVNQGGILSVKQIALLDRVVQDNQKAPTVPAPLGPQPVKLPHGDTWTLYSPRVRDTVHFTVTGHNHVVITSVYASGQVKSATQDFEGAEDVWGMLQAQHGFDPQGRKDSPPWTATDEPEPIEAPKEDPLIEVLRKMYREAQRDGNNWLMEFTKSIADKLKRGEPLSDKQQASVDKNRNYYRLASKVADRYLTTS